MAVSRADRRRERTEAVVALFGLDQAGVVLDLFEIVELAWHDCYGEITPDESSIVDMLLLSDGHLDRLIAAARLGVTDWRDLKVAAINRRGGVTSPVMTLDEISALEVRLRRPDAGGKAT